MKIHSGFGVFARVGQLTTGKLDFAGAKGETGNRIAGWGGGGGRGRIKVPGAGKSFPFRSAPAGGHPGKPGVRANCRKRARSRERRSIAASARCGLLRARSSSLQIETSSSVDTHRREQSYLCSFRPRDFVV